MGTGETCDDGNHSDNDSCPADCRIAACTVTTATRFVQVRFVPPLGANVAGLTVLVDYPEGKVDLPGNGTSGFPSGTFSGVPSGSTISVNDLNFNGKGHALRYTIAGQSGGALTPGQILRLKMLDCAGVVAPTADEFLCTVIAASDPFTNHIDGVRCFVVVE